MNESFHDETSWYQALTLAERAESLQAGRNAAAGQGFDAGRATEMLEEWRLQRPFSAESLFADRMRLDGISEDTLFQLLGEPIENVRRRVFPPAWLNQISDSFLPSSPAMEREPSASLKIWPLLQPFHSLISEAQVRLSQRIDGLIATVAKLPFDRSSIERILFAGLPLRLSQIVNRTLVLELNVARLMDKLQGETPKDRFRYYIDTLSDRDSVLALLREYPVLGRQMTVALNQWVEFSMEFLTHLIADWDHIRALFSGHQDLGILEEIEGGVGDSHRQGRSVRIVRFSSGLWLVYKPKQMAVEKHFQELLEWINEHDSSSLSGEKCFRTLKVADRGTHGWMEFVHPESCDSLEGVRRFYQRQGAYLALLYVLEAVDFHYENLIASGENPVLIDLEALFHPRMEGDIHRSAAGLASDKLRHSVTRSGLLPRRVLASDESEGLDVGGLSSTNGQLTPLEIPTWEEPATDLMRFTRKRLPLGESRNRPMLQGETVDLLDYADAIVEGFARLYRLLQRHREELLAPGGCISSFENDEVRVILRPTMSYVVLLDESYHPDVLRDALDRDRLFDRLWLAVERMPSLRRVLHAEREDLLRGDVPFFRTAPASRDLWSATDEQIPNFFEESGMSMVRRRLNTLSETDLEQQLWFVRAALATQPVPGDRPCTGHLHREPRSPIQRNGLLDAARAVGDRLEALALRGDNDVTWIGLTAVRQSYASLTPLRLELYDGLSGVTLFLAHLASITGEERYRALVEGTLVTLRHQLSDSRTYLRSIGGFGGWGGAIYTLAQLAVVLDRPALLEDAEVIVQFLPPLIEGDTGLDMLAGAAGCICGLLALHHCAPSRRTLEAAALCGERLLATSQPAGGGSGWVTRAATKPLAGLSHGAAGYTMALLDLAVATGDKRFERAALASLEYERELFSPEMQNWPDLRDLTITGKLMEVVQTGVTAWCHGAMGIGLSRLRSMRHLDSPALLTDVEIAIRTTLDHGFGMNHSLCHGDFGNLELLLEGTRKLGDARCQAHLNRLVAVILEDIEKDGWICGNALDVESPGLMTGIAGIGYQLLRIAEPERVPSVLVLEPPRIKPERGVAAEDQLVCAA